MIKIVADTPKYTIIEFIEPAIIRWNGQGRSYVFDIDWLYVYNPYTNNSWHRYLPKFAHVQAIGYADQVRILNHLLEEERKRTCHLSS